MYRNKSKYNISIAMIKVFSISIDSNSTNWLGTAAAAGSAKGQFCSASELLIDSYQTNVMTNGFAMPPFLGEHCALCRVPIGRASRAFQLERKKCAEQTATQLKLTPKGFASYSTTKSTVGHRIAYI